MRFFFVCYSRVIFVLRLLFRHTCWELHRYTGLLLLNNMQCPKFSLL